MLRIVIITQNDPFFLPDILDYLLSHLPERSAVVGCVVTDVSPFGKKESFLLKAKRTLRVFGIHFFIRYGFDFIASKLPNKPTVRKVLRLHKIPEIRIHDSLNSQDSLSTLRGLSPDLLVSVAANEIFRRPLIDLAPMGCLNLHTSLLPKYRGLMPSFWVLKNKESETGVSVFFVDEGIDSGPILIQERITIGSMTQRELIKTSKLLAMKAAIKSIERVRDDDISTLPNDKEDSTYFHFPTRKDVREFLAGGGRFF